MADRSVKRLIALVNEILDAERLESGHLSIDRQPESLQEIFQFSYESVCGLSQSAGVHIEVGDTEVRLNADKNRLVQAIVNLLSNAIKFSPAGSVIKLQAVVVGDAVEVGVKDQGRGIPAEHLELIFKRFHQVEGTDSTEKGGTGLGLAICKAIVEGQEGVIGVSSEPGQGGSVNRFVSKVES